MRKAVPVNSPLSFSFILSEKTSPNLRKYSYNSRGSFPLGIFLTYKLFFESLFFIKNFFSSRIILIFLFFNFFWFKSCLHLSANSKSLNSILTLEGFVSVILTKSKLDLYWDKNDSMSDCVTPGGRSQRIRVIFCEEFSEDIF